MGIIRERRRLAQRRRSRAMLSAAGLLVAAGLLAARCGMNAGWIPAFSQEKAQFEWILPHREIYALQLGVFDSGERAADEAQRLAQQGVRCIVWQRDRMRIVCSVALTREALDRSGAAGREVYVIKDVLRKVPLRISCAAQEMEAVQTLLQTPDTILMELLSGEAASLAALVADTRRIAAQALGAHPENALYTQLAQSLLNWCSLMDTAQQTADDQQARSYAALTMCTLCRELRETLYASGEAA